MFSDGSDDEDESLNERQSYSWPSLRLYEKEEEIFKRFEVTPSPENLVDRQFRQYLRLSRFFKSVEGFYTGSLDLTGRHRYRYELLSSRWETFLPDFNDLASTVDVHKVEETQKDKKFVRTNYTINDAEKWENFKTRWNMKSITTYEDVEEGVRNLLKTVGDRPWAPKIQKICLIHLPVELLSMIFSVATVDQAKLLYSTCRLLRDIGRPYVLMSRNLHLHFPASMPGEWRKILREAPDSITMETISSAAEDCKREVLQNTAFLLSRPDIVSRVCRLRLADEMSIILRGAGVGSCLSEDFYEPVWKAFTDVVLQCQRLTQLSLFQIDISEEMLLEIISLPKLVQLDFNSCIIPEEVLQKIYSGVILPSTTVLNFDIVDTDVEGSNLWDYIACFSNLRTLSVRRVRKADIDSLWEPSDDICNHSRAFTTLQKFYIGPQVNRRDIVALTRWIEVNAALAPLQLSHLKIATNICLDDEVIFGLIDALASAPLEVLVIDGIKEGSFELFDRIARSFPRLKGLTLMRRETVSQKRCKLSDWPYPSWQYAEHFSAFRYLEHFAWNFGHRSSESTPYGLQHFEDRFMTREEYLAQLRTLIKKEFYMDNYYYAYPFAAYCPTLKTFAIYTESYRSSSNYCSIKRTPFGSAELQEVTDDGAFGFLNKWDISQDETHWPHILRMGS